MSRIDKDSYYLNIAQEVMKRSTCIRRNYGAVIVKDDQIISTGYNGSCRGEENCCDVGTCIRQELGVPAGERYELCVAIHAELNALLSIERHRAIGATIYITGEEYDTKKLANATPCKMCMRSIKNMGITRIVMRVGANKFDEIILNKSK